jgi:hypothetical protein
VLKNTKIPEIKADSENASTEKMRSDLEEYFECSICYEVLIDPKSCSLCESNFCAICIEKALKALPECPCCR